MDMIFKIIMGIIIFLAFVFIFIFFYSSSTEATNREIAIYYENKKLYSGANPLYTSNYNNKIIYATPVGIKEYDIETNTSIILNPQATKVIGLAYDNNSGKYIVLDKFGILYNLSSEGALTEIGSGYSILYDTQIGGYYMKSGEDYSYVGGRSTKNNGIFGNIRLRLA